MARNSGVEWCDHTHNPWWGCEKTSPACAHCYAAEFANWLAPGLWGKDAPRKMQSDKTWEQPLKWNASARRRKTRERVFCASMCDVFEQLAAGHPQRAELDRARGRLWDLIAKTPHLDWLLLTKHPEHIIEHEPFRNGVRFRNVWLGTTVEDEKRRDERMPHLVRAPAVVKFVSCEPLLEHVNMRAWLGQVVDDGKRCRPRHGGGVRDSDGVVRDGVDWVIAGGESGRQARASSPRWFDSLRQQAEDAGVPFFFKQWGAWSPVGLLSAGLRRRTLMKRAEIEGYDMRRVTAKADRPAALLKQGDHGRWKGYQQFPKQARLFAA